MTPKEKLIFESQRSAPVNVTGTSSTEVIAGTTDLGIVPVQIIFSNDDSSPAEVSLREGNGGAVFTQIDVPAQDNTVWEPQGLELATNSGLYASLAGPGDVEITPFWVERDNAAPRDKDNAIPGYQGHGKGSWHTTSHKSEPRAKEFFEDN